MPVLRAAITEGKAATLRLAHLPRPTAEVVVVQALALPQCLPAEAEAASAQKV